MKQKIDLLKLKFGIRWLEWKKDRIFWMLDWEIKNVGLEYEKGDYRWG